MTKLDRHLLSSCLQARIAVREQVSHEETLSLVRDNFRSERFLFLNEMKLSELRQIQEIPTWQR